MGEILPVQELNHKKQTFAWFKLFVVVTMATALGGAFALWLATVYLFPREFKPVTLQASEEKVLQNKLSYLESKAYSSTAVRPGETRAADGRVEPQAYSETGANREITFTEREVNALLAKNTNLAQKLAIDFSDNLASARLILPVDKDFPVLGGKTIKVSAGLDLSFSNGKPSVILRGISLWGAPLPNAWLGNLKNVDLVQKFGSEKGFWRAFAAGVEDIKIRDGHLYLKLKE